MTAIIVTWVAVSFPAALLLGAMIKHADRQRQRETERYQMWLERNPVDAP